MVGALLRPLTDRVYVSREKLAYIVDSMSSPVAALSPISTRIAFEMGVLSLVNSQLQLGLGPYQQLAACLPWRFFCFSTIFTVVIGQVYAPLP